MVRTILILIFTLIVLPIFAFYFDSPLSDLQETILIHLVVGMGALALLCFLVGELTKNNSQVDKLWSIVPAIYVWYIAYAGDWNPRVVLMASLVTLWAVRLTYNFARRGGYHLKFWTGDEDYRWEILRQSPPLNKRWVWTLFNLFFISIYQMALILLFCLPALVALEGADNPINIYDIALAVVMVMLVGIEYTADQQQWDFQNEKHRLKKEGKPLVGNFAAGFIHTGLWKYSRHPNYAAEQSIWMVFYFFSVVATERWLNWSAAGFLLLIILFKGSSDFSEKITSGKYPFYEEYKKKTGRFLPKLF